MIPKRTRPTRFSGQDAEKKLPGKSGRKSSKGSTGVGNVIFGIDGGLIAWLAFGSHN